MGYLPTLSTSIVLKVCSVEKGKSAVLPFSVSLFWIFMTTLVLATDIPTSINTLERLHAWSGLALAFLNPTLAVLETPNSPQKVAQAQIFQASDNTTRLLVRSTLVLPDGYSSDRTIKLWQMTEEFSNVALPTGYKSN